MLYRRTQYKFIYRRSADVRPQRPFNTGSTSTYYIGNSELLQTFLYCAFDLSTLSPTVNALSLTPLQHSGTHFQKASDFLSQSLPLDQHSRPTFFQHKDKVLID